MEHYAAHIQSKRNSTEFAQMSNIDGSMKYEQVKNEQVDDILDTTKTFYESREKAKHFKD